MTSDSLPKTDPTRWRLHTSAIGVHTWTYLPATALPTSRPQTFAEKYFLGLASPSTSLPPPHTYSSAARNGLLFYSQLQLESGHWSSSYAGPSFTLPGLVVALYITDGAIPAEWAIDMTQWVCRYQNDDGGWGLHIPGRSTLFATVLYYVSLRILGIDEGHAVTVRARGWIRGMGGAVAVPQWGRYWLALLNLYEWEGVQPVPSELWTLPTWIPIHPWRWWVQCRSVYLPVSYLYSNRCQIPLNDFLLALRRELYTQPYDSINFNEYIHTVSPVDRKRPLNLFLTVVNHVLRTWEWYIRPLWLHSHANAVVRALIRREDENTAYNDIATVNKAFHTVAVHFADGANNSAVKLHWEKVLPYLWRDEVGLNAGGTNGAQLWDTAFSVIAIVEAGLGEDAQFNSVLEKAHKFLEVSQFRDDVDDPFRQARKGGWPFSTRDQSYIVSDCAAEGLKATLMLQEELGFSKLISKQRLYDCVDTLLKMQNPDHGFGSYEKARVGTYIELLNPAEVFDRCMVEYSYPECTTAVITGLAMFRKYYPSHAGKKIDEVIQSATGYLKSNQWQDGSWYGSWGICFTYGTMFALEGLAATGLTYATSEEVRRACHFLVEKQKDDGGWGEHWESCERREYVEHEESQVVNTAWAVLGLMAARFPDRAVIARGLEIIRRRQQPNGEWLQEAVSGIFNCTCTIEYPNYKFHFSIRALGRFEHEYVPAMNTIARE
ncbi:terpene synthase [Bimuria novae-zelandiae CBS 107.79]|uniref:Terpene cyclase/mutase family member n=1 Tax=Bimuria novae-zelandiae CBS 107.79 TaxID=1447943 RepID=A0A6A5V674_9PLEO|nr:terpene synthase [Bimuria novae-zelandiae CBS 107.79]